MVPRSIRGEGTIKNVMKKQTQKYIIFIVLISILIMPSFTLAAWWNPFSWHIWSNVYNTVFHKQNIEVKNANKPSNPTIDPVAVIKDACFEAGGIPCENGQCPSGSKIINGINCCLGNCYDTSKTCSQLGGVIGLFNACAGDRINSSDTISKEFGSAHPGEVCCVGKINAQSCVAKLGQLAFDGCESRCSSCSCENNKYPIKMQDATKLNWTWDNYRKNYICLLNPSSKEPEWKSSAGYSDVCSGDNLTKPCRCGNYACGFIGGTNSCKNGVCSSKNECSILSNGQSKECDDNNLNTLDTCVQDISQNKLICKHQTITLTPPIVGASKCSDGTEWGKCSATKPKMCAKDVITGKLTFIDDCKTCGCPMALNCDTKSDLCYNASAQTQYMFTSSDLQSTGYDSSKFVNSTSTQNTSNGQTVILYRQEAKYYQIQIIHYQGSSASSVYDNDLAFYQLVKATIVKTNEYGDRSVKMKLTGNSGVEGGFLLIQKGDDELEFAYLLSDEEKINSLVSMALQKIQ